MTMTETGRNFIEHFGVKGMRWGVRRSKAQLDGGKAEKSEKDDGDGEKKLSGAAKTSSEKNSRSPSKSVADMSDKELKDYVNRLNMEQQYAKMQPTPITRRAAKFATDIAVGALKQQLTNQLSNEIGDALKTARSSRSKAPKLPEHLGPKKLAAPNAADRLG